MPPDNPEKEVERAECKTCGAPNTKDAVFCSKCGSRMKRLYSCPFCSGEVDINGRFCSNCGRDMYPGLNKEITSRHLTTLLLGLIPGLLSIWGIDYFFIGSFWKGLMFLLIGLAFWLVIPFGLLGAASVNNGLAGLYGVVVVLFWIFLWLWQSVDAYKDAGGD